MDSEIKVCEFIDSYYPVIDGVVTVVNNYANYFAKKGKSVVVCPKHKKYVDKFSYGVYRVKAVKLMYRGYDIAFPKLDRKMKKKLLKEDFDIFHAHSPFGIGKFAQRIAKKKGIPIVATLHSQYHQDFYNACKSKCITKIMIKNIMKKFYNKVDYVWTLNEGMGRLLKSYGYKGEYDIVRNATDFKYPDNPEFVENRARGEFNIPKDIPVFLFVGQIINAKGIRLIAEALKKVKDLGFKFKMLMVGKGKDKESLEAYVKELGLEEEYQFLGAIYDRELLSGVYMCSTLFLFPSLYDSFSLVKLEAASQKRATLFASGALAADGIIDNRNGFLAEYDAEKYANKIIEIINDKELLEKVSNNAYDELYINWDTALITVEQKYREIIEDYKAKHNKK